MMGMHQSDRNINRERSSLPVGEVTPRIPWPLRFMLRAFLTRVIRQLPIPLHCRSHLPIRVQAMILQNRKFIRLNN